MSQKKEAGPGADGHVRMVVALICLLPLADACTQSDQKSAGRNAETLIKNADFAHPSGGLPHGWLFEDRVRHKGEVSVDRESRPAGQLALRLSPNAQNDEPLLPLAVGQALPVDQVRGKELTLSAHLAATGGGVAEFGLFAIRLDGIIVGSTVLTRTSANPDFAYKHGVFKVPSTKDVAFVIARCAVKGTTGSAYFVDPAVHIRDSRLLNRAAETTELLAQAARINTLGWEDSPYVTPDGRHLYFMYSTWNFFPGFRGSPPVNQGPARPGHVSNPNAWKDDNVYMANRNEDGTWSTPFHLFQGCCAMPSADGNTIYYQADVPELPNPDALYNQNIDLCMRSKNEVGDFREPVSLGASINSIWNEINPHISADGNTIYFTSNRPGGYGKNDLYYATKDPSGSWEEATDMGPSINTPEDEDQIWVSADGRTVFFNRGLSVYVSTFRSGEWSRAERIAFGGFEVGEVSLTDEGEMFMMVVDYEKQDIIFSVSERQADGTWGRPRAVD